MKIDRENLKYILIIIAVGLLAWYQTLGFWFFKAYEATWLMGWLPHNIVNLIKSHSFLYFLDWKLFGWNPWGWYATSLTLHLIASILLFFLVFLISKNRLLSFVSSLFFVASTAYNDVLTWGSFNSYYPLLLSLMLLAIITYLKFKETKRVFFLFLSLLFTFLGFFVRETGIIIVPLLLIYEIVFSKNTKDKKNIVGILKNLVLFLIILVIFFALRSTYGGTGGDTADSNVKLQMRLVSDGLYLEYAKASVLTFGKLIPPQIIPYPFLNSIREVFTRFIYYDLVNTYFFPIVGWLLFIVLGVLLHILRKSKEYFRLLLFFWIWMGLFSLFVSLAIPNTSEVLAREYEYNTMRYRYFAFVGMSVVLASFLVTILIRKSMLLYLIVSSVVVANLLLLWGIEKNVYALSYKPAKEFYMKFTSYFPTLPKESVFYLYPHASGLSDYLLEWYLIKDESYPNLVGQPFRVESQIIAVMDKVKKSKIQLSSVIFLDYDQKLGLLDKSKEVRNILANQKEYSVNLLSAGDNYFKGDLSGPQTEFPYDLKIYIRLGTKEKFVGSKPDSSKFRALIDYAVDRNQYLNSVRIDTAYTASQREGEPFFHTLPAHLVDGNIGPRSHWIADTFTPWIQVDLGKEEEIVAIIWGSQPDSTRIPATYSIFGSLDGREWQEIRTVKNSNKSTSIEAFDRPIQTRFVKMEISTTSGGDFVLLDEFEVVTARAKKILEFYKDRNKLLEDSHEIFKFASSRDDLDYAYNNLDIHWGKLSWETDKTSSSQNNQFWYFPYSIRKSEQDISIQIKEGEVYAGTGQFLHKHINSISIEFGDIPFIVQVDNPRLSPRIRL